jgi:hypothetical protein
MSPDPGPSILQARGVGIRKRAESMALQAEQASTKDQIAMVATAAPDALAWLHDPTVGDIADRLRSIDASLQAQAKRLDELET